MTRIPKSIGVCLVFIAGLLISEGAQANVVLKVLGVNPSKTDTQKVSIKAYLPKEIKPEDVLDKGDLDIAFDNQQGSYFVFGEYDVAPGKTIEREIELRDIWNVPSADLESLRSEATKIESMLKGTDFSDRMMYLKNSIDSKLLQVEESQKNSASNPERHISDYRDNLKILDSVKADLAVARNLMTQYRPMPAVTIWKIVVGIVIFLGLLGGSFYFIWQRQSKTLLQDPFYVPPSDAPAPPARHEGQPTKKTTPREGDKSGGAT